jgi:hypothetical protein
MNLATNEWARLCGANAYGEGVPRTAVPLPVAGQWLDGWDAASRGERVVAEPVTTTHLESLVYSINGTQMAHGWSGIAVSCGVRAES